MQTRQDTLSPEPAAGAVPICARPLVRLILLLAVVAAGHGMSVRSGLWLDDHLHYQQLQKAHWTVRDLVDASRLDVGVNRVRFWGSQAIDLRFFRPVAFGIMKAEYSLVGWHPGPMHVFHLLWHVAVAWMVGSLVAGLLRDRSAGTMASLLFAAFPNHVLSVYWISCQPELLVTFFVLIATLSYGRWAGWIETGRPSRGWLVLALVAFALALGCRENAIVWPGILLAGDLLTGRWRRVRRAIPAYLLVAGLVVLYFLVRTALLGTTVPHRPYLVYPSDPDFVEFAGIKVLYYLAGLFLYVPVLPGAAATYFAHKTYLLPIGLAWSGLIAAAALRFWRWRVLLGIAWIALVLGPILPVQPYSPHHLYLPAVGSTLLLTAGILGLWRWVRDRRPRWRQAEPWLSGIAGGIAGLTMVAACFVGGWLFVFGSASEDQLVSDVLTRGDPLASGDELFFINQPMVAGWPGPAIETATGNRLHDLTTYTLTLSDEVVLMTQPSYVTAPDRYNLQLQSGPPGWMEGASGKVFAELSGTGWPFQAGQIVKGPAFDVTIGQVDPRSGGITEMAFRFHEPLDKPGRHFYFGSPYQVAYPLHFQWDPAAAVTGP
jgi:hypothetical protein